VPTLRLVVLDCLHGSVHSATDLPASECGLAGAQSGSGLQVRRPLEPRYEPLAAAANFANADLVWFWFGLVWFAAVSCRGVGAGCMIGCPRASARSACPALHVLQAAVVGRYGSGSLAVSAGGAVALLTLRLDAPTLANALGSLALAATPPAATPGAPLLAGLEAGDDVNGESTAAAFVHAARRALDGSELRSLAAPRYDAAREIAYDFAVPLDPGTEAPGTAQPLLSRSAVRCAALLQHCAAQCTAAQCNAAGAAHCAQCDRAPLTSRCCLAPPQVGGSCCISRHGVR
jgi:hypothetical protein